MYQNIKRIALLCFLSYGSATAQSLNTQKLDSLFQALDQNKKAMGSVAISKRGTILYKRSIGYANMQQKQFATPETEYQIGSISKVFTATIIFQLIDEGRLTLDTRLDKYFPAMPNAKDITIKALLSHRCGLYDFVNDTKDVTFLTKPRSKKELLSIIQNGPPHFKPDTKMEYSNSGFLLLSYIIEDITKQKYSDALQSRICKKLHLTHTLSSTPANKNIAISYSAIKDGEAITDLYFPNVQGVGDIVSTPTELIQFNEALIHGQLISKQSLAIMLTHTEGQFCNGIMKIPFDNKDAYGHGGDTYGTHSLVGTFPSDSLSIAFCDNAEVYPHNDIAIAILSICFNKSFSIPDFKSFDNSQEELDKYLGQYSSKDIPLKIAITKDNKTLKAQATGQPSFPLEGSAKDIFKFEPAGVVIKFNPAKEEMVLEQGGGKFLFTKDKQ